jgi:hypothetical protein
MLLLRKEFPKPADKRNLRNLFQEPLWKFRNLNMIFPLLLPQYHRPQGIHHPGNIDPFGTSRRALKTRSTEPKGIDSEDLFFQTQKGISNGLVWPDFHGKGNWTTRCTIPTLIAGEEVLPANQFHFLRKFVVNLLPSEFNLHHPSPTFTYLAMNVAITYPMVKRAWVPKIVMTFMPNTGTN